MWCEKAQLEKAIEGTILATVVPRSCAQRYVESLSTARLVVLDGCGHCAEVEKSQELAVLITDFIAGARWPVHGR